MTENQLLHAYGVPLHKASRNALYSQAAIGVRIEHDAEPCLPSVEVVKARSPFANDPRPVLTRVPAPKVAA